MGGRGASSNVSRGSSKGNLKPITYNEEWVYQPDEFTDMNDLRENPIPFVGVGEDYRIGEILEDNTVQTGYDSNTSIDVSKLETLQPFVLQSGIDNYKRFDSTERPYVAELDGHYYLLDGNHRAAIAKLNGQKTINVDLSHRLRR